MNKSQISRYKFLGREQERKRVLKIIEKEMEEIVKIRRKALSLNALVHPLAKNLIDNRVFELSGLDRMKDKIKRGR